MNSYIKLIILFGTFYTSSQDTVIECEKDNEHYECGSACQTTCENFDDECPIINIRCNDACYCNDGYARNTTGDCIPIKKCPPKKHPPIQCKPNESYYCGGACQTECATLGERCPKETKVCSCNCYCNKGYARDNLGRCVLIKECPQMPLLNCDKPHEHYECGSCQTTCDNYKKPCPIQNIKCNDACYCNSGYARDRNGRCIPLWQCPTIPGPFPCKNPNEHYEYGNVCEKHCATLDKPCIYLSTIDGCYCNEGYARNEHGVCILVELCPKAPCQCRHPCQCT